MDFIGDRVMIKETQEKDLKQKRKLMQFGRNHRRTIQLQGNYIVDVD